MACPKVVWRPRGLASYAVSSLGELIVGERGLLEPDPDRAEPIGEEIDLVLVPGLAFDRNGGRIGYGAGFYDRFLAGTPAVKVALAYSLQLIDAVPVEPHDVPVDRILTEEESIVCRVAGGRMDGKEERA